MAELNCHRCHNPLSLTDIERPMLVCDNGHVAKRTLAVAHLIMAKLTAIREETQG